MICKLPDCVKDAAVSQLCWTHYCRLRKYGSYELPNPVCTVCGESYKGQNRSGTQFCPTCREDANRERVKKWTADHSDELRAYKAKHYRENSDLYKARSAKWKRDNPERAAENYRSWVHQNRDKMVAYNVKWARKNAEAIRKRSREQYTANPTPAREQVRRRRAKRKNNPMYTVTPRDLDRLLRRHDYKCAYCKNDLNGTYHIDHVVPLSRGGSSGIGNYLPACPFCNTSKGAKLLTEWRKWQRTTENLLA